MLFCVFFVYEIIFTSLEHFEYYFSFSTSVFFLFHKCPLLLLVPYKSDSRAVNRDWAPLGFGTPLGGKLGFFSTSSAPAWLVLPKMDQCHCLYLYLGKYFTFFFTLFIQRRPKNIHKLRWRIHEMGTDLKRWVYDSRVGGKKKE